MFTPFGNSSQAVVHWQPEPTTRGTSTILTTCIITITLCVWTAIHMNIPAADERQGKTPVWRKIGWLIVALIAPEFVVYTAWYQRRIASEMLRGLQNIFGQEPPPNRFVRMRRKIFNKHAGDSRDLQKDEQSPKSSTPVSKIRYQWTMTHAFFALMGGFAVDTRGTGDAYFPDDASRELVFNYMGLKALAQDRPQFLDVSKDDILDKSKASGLVKSVACIQALWFCTQCICRLAQLRLISLLELNTFAHCLCALLIYFMWWHKPQDIAVPTVIRGREAKETLHWLWEQGSHRGWGERERLGDLIIQELSKLTSNKLRKWITSKIISAYGLDTVLESTHHDRRFYKNAILNLLYGEALIGINRRPRARYHDDSQLRDDPEPQTRCSGHEVDNVRHLSVLCSDRWRHNEYPDRKCNGTSYPWRISFIDTPLSEFQYSVIKARCAQDKLFVHRRSNNRPSSLEIDDHDAVSPLLVAAYLVLCTFLYGGVHALAWNAAFPSQIQRIAWRTSALLTASSGAASLLAVALLLSFALIMEGPAGKHLDRVEDYLKYRFPMTYGCLEILFTVLAIIGIILIPFCAVVFYLGARTFLVVGSFISLFNSPAGIYDVPNWTLYVPHVT